LLCRLRWPDWRRFHYLVGLGEKQRARGPGALRYLLPGLLLFVAIACNRVSGEPIPDVPQVELFEVQTATALPVATSTPAPTATPEPEPFEWSEVAKPPFVGPTLVLNDGRVLVRENRELGDSAVYDPESDVWELQGEPLFPAIASAVLPGGRVIVFNYGFRNFVWDRTQIFDPDSGLWSEGPRGHFDERVRAYAVLDDGRILLIKGVDEEFDEIYDSETDSWQQIPSSIQFSVLIDRAVNASLGQGRYLFAIRQGGLWIFDSALTSWEEAVPPNEARRDARLVELPGNKVLYYSGTDITGFTNAPAKTVEVFDPSANTWSIWQPASLVDEDLFMIDVWVVDDVGTILGEFAPRTELDVLDGLLPELGLYDPVQNQWTMFDRTFDTREYILLPGRRLMRVDQTIAGEISAWMTVLP